MKTVICLPFLSAFVLFLNGCSNQGGGSDGGPGTGPFDSNGNYVEAWADDPSKWRRPGQKPPKDDPPVIAKNEQPPPNATPITPTSKPEPAIVKVTPKPKPKPTPKPKPKPKPTVTRYTVKKGDTLSAIARRYGSSVSAIQRANGISGSLIHPGKSLVIPKR